MSNLPPDLPAPATGTRSITPYPSARHKLRDEDSVIPWPAPRMRPGGVGTGRPTLPVRRLPRGTRSPAVGLAGLIVAGLLAAFFGWVSAEPAWLTLGHGSRAVATVTGCSGQGIGRQCR